MRSREPGYIRICPVPCDNVGVNVSCVRNAGLTCNPGGKHQFPDIIKQKIAAEQEQGN